jgi:hypothetical protein
MLSLGDRVIIRCENRFGHGRVVSERLREKGCYGIYRVAFRNGANECYADFSEEILSVIK